APDGEGNAHRCEGSHVRLPNSAHEAHRWVIAQIAPEFTLLDAWAVPVQGGRDEFASFLEGMVSFDPANAESAALRALFSLRRRLGAFSVGTMPPRNVRSPGAPKRR